MKSSLNKALIFKEIKYTKYQLMIFLITLILESSYGFAKALNKISTGVDVNIISEGLKYMNLNISHHVYSGEIIINFIYAISLAYLLIGIERRKNYEFLEVMPFSRYEIIKNKYLFGLISILVCMLINFIIFSIIYAINIDTINNIPKIALMLHYKCDNLKNPVDCQYYYDLYLTTRITYITVIKSFIINLLTLIAAFSLSMLMHTISGKSVLGFIFSIISYIFPIGIFVLCSEVLSYHIPWSDEVCLHFEKFLKNIYVLTYTYDDYLKGYWPNCIKIIIFIIIINILLFYCYKKYKQENVGNLIVFEKLEPIVIIGASICFGMLIGTIIGRITMGYSSSPSVSRAIILDTLIIIISIISYIIISRINKSVKN